MMMAPAMATQTKITQSVMRLGAFSVAGADTSGTMGAVDSSSGSADAAITSGSSTSCVDGISSGVSEGAGSSMISTGAVVTVSVAVAPPLDSA
jgi:hypothetical protein